MCFRPDIAHEALELIGAMICKLDDDKKIKSYCVAVGSDENNNIQFYHLGSTKQIEAFPELVKTNDTND